MREMHEIESQRSAVPPIPASAVKDHLHNDAWAQQYIEDGKRFQVIILMKFVYSTFLDHEY